MRDPQRVRLELLARDLLPERQNEQIEEVLHEREAQLVVGARVDPEAELGPKGRVLQQAGLHHVGLRDAELLIGRLEVGVVDQRDLDGARPRVRPLRREAADPLGDLRVVGRSLLPSRLVPGSLRDKRGHLIVPALRRHSWRRKEPGGVGGGGGVGWCGGWGLKKKKGGGGCFWLG